MYVCRNKCGSRYILSHSLEKAIKLNEIEIKHGKEVSKNTAFHKDFKKTPPSMKKKNVNVNPIVGLIKGHVHDLS